MFLKILLYSAIRIRLAKLHPVIIHFINSIIDVIYLNGLYIEPYFTKGVKGFRIFHDCDYFKERMFYHKD